MLFNKKQSKHGVDARNSINENKLMYIWQQNYLFLRERSFIISFIDVDLHYTRGE